SLLSGMTSSGTERTPTAMRLTKLGRFSCYPRSSLVRPPGAGSAGCGARTSGSAGDVEGAFDRGTPRGAYVLAGRLGSGRSVAVEDRVQNRPMDDPGLLQSALDVQRRGHTAYQDVAEYALGLLQEAVAGGLHDALMEGRVQQLKFIEIHRLPRGRLEQPV